jgi:hypothetical protein
MSVHRWIRTGPSPTAVLAKFDRDNYVAGVIAPPLGHNYQQQRIFRVAYQVRVGGRFRVGEQGYAAAGGWKIHVSAHPFNAQRVANLVLPILCNLHVWHKYVNSTTDLAQMTDGQEGKFITVYPNPDNIDSPTGWRNVVALIRGAFVNANVLQPIVMDPRESHYDPDGVKLPVGISMRHVEDFTRG